MSSQSGEMLPVTPFPQTARAPLVPFPDGAYRANLYVYDPQGRIDWYALVPQSFFNGRYFTVGRGPECNITLGDGSVSTRHSCIMANSGQLVLRDLQSTNGTFLNDRKISEGVLNHGDVVRIGATDIRFLYSYRDSPVRLVLEFTHGPNAGRAIAANSASTNIGRLNCAVNLQGRSVAPQHVRVDAFGRELLFVVSLDRDHDTFLNGHPVVGIAPARQGDTLRIGEHELVLRVLDADEVERGLPQQDGTLIMPEMLKDTAAGDNVAVVSAGQLARLEAHLQDLETQDDTSMDLVGAPILDRPTAPSIRKIVPEPAEVPEKPARRRRSFKWLLIPLFLVLPFVAAHFIQIPQAVQLQGVVAAGAQTTLRAPVRGRAENLYFRAGEKVVVGDVVANVVDLAAKAEIDRVAAQIATLEANAQPTPKRVAVKAPAAVQRELERAEAEAAGAKARVQSVEAAFNRREVPFDALEAARAAHNQARRKVASLQARTRRGTRVTTAEPDDALLEQIAALVAKKEALTRKLRAPIKATAAGLLVEAGATPIQVGTLLDADQPLYHIVDTSRVRLQFTVPAKDLGAVEGANARVELEGFPGRPVRVKLGRAGPVAQGGTLPLETVVQNADGTFRPGQKVSATVDRPTISALEWLVDRASN